MAAPALGHYVVPISVLILVGLFALQRRGTGGMGRLFGPVMLLWFAVLAGLGLHGLWQTPEVLRALDPRIGERVHDIQVEVAEEQLAQERATRPVLLAGLFGDTAGFDLCGRLLLVSGHGDLLEAPITQTARLRPHPPAPAPRRPRRVQ